MISLSSLGDLVLNRYYEHAYVIILDYAFENFFTAMRTTLIFRKYVSLLNEFNSVMKISCIENLSIPKFLFRISWIFSQIVFDWDLFSEKVCDLSIK